MYGLVDGLLLKRADQVQGNMCGCCHQPQQEEARVTIFDPQDSLHLISFKAYVSIQSIPSSYCDTHTLRYITLFSYFWWWRGYGYLCWKWSSLFFFFYLPQAFLPESPIISLSIFCYNWFCQASFFFLSLPPSFSVLQPKQKHPKSHTLSHGYVFTSSIVLPAAHFLSVLHTGFQAQICCSQKKLCVVSSVEILICAFL